MRRSATIVVVLATVALAGFAGAPAEAQQLERMRAYMSANGGPAPIVGGRCPGITVPVRATGYATWLGAYTAEQEHCVDPTGPDPLAFTDGIYRWTNDSGDGIFGRYNGRLRPAEGTDVHGFFLVEGRFSIDGGAGRFAGATGHGVADGLLNPATGQFNIALDAAFALPPGTAVVSALRRAEPPGGLILPRPGFIQAAP